MLKTTLGLSLGALACAGFAFAQGMPMGHEDPFGGKTITRAEAQAHAEAMFDKMDANHDGKLDQTDRAAHEAARRAAMFDKIDTNHDGMISRDEFAAFHHRDEAKPGDADAGKHHGWREGREGPMMMLKMADANHDGVVTKDEFVAAALKHFDMADANHDGKLTPEERKAAHEKMGMMHHHHARGGGDDAPPPPPAG